MQIKITTRIDVQSEIEGNSAKEVFRYMKSMKGGNSRVKISIKFYTVISTFFHRFLRSKTTHSGYQQ